MANVTSNFLIHGYLPIIANGAIAALKMSVVTTPDATGVIRAKKPAADSDPWLGVADAAILTTVAGELKIDGVVLLTLNATIAAGVELMMDVSGGHEGEMIAATSGKQVCGILLEGGDAANVRAVRLCRYFKP